MQLQQSLQPYNSFGIDIPAEKFFILSNQEDIPGLISKVEDRSSIHILGGGSNILLTSPVQGLVVHNRLKGIKELARDDEYVWLEVSSGEVWHDLVMYSLEKGLSGLENLALIPGTVGAAPIQNIGAYGVEVCETIQQVTAWFWEEACYLTLTNEECRFGYRDSIFKQALKGKILITSVVFKLSRKPINRTSYGAINQELEKMGVSEVNPHTIAAAVMSIRRSKLPDPKVLGNAGSFFKNPVIPNELFHLLQQQSPDIPWFPVNEDTVKVPAAWLIEACGWKGYRRGAIGVHERQALVLVNYGGGTGDALYDLSEEIIQSVKQRYRITLEREVQVW